MKRWLLAEVKGGSFLVALVFLLGDALTKAVLIKKPLIGGLLTVSER